MLGIARFKLITFDGDQTLYADQQNFSDSLLAHQLLILLQSGISIALVTAANYGLSGEKYETRLRGLLDYFQRLNVPQSILDSFYVVAGESNFLLKIKRLETAESGVFEYRILGHNEVWPCNIADLTPNMREALDLCESTLRTAIQDMNMKGQVSALRTAIQDMNVGEEGLGI